MKIKYLGHSSFLLTGKNAKVVTDPFDPKMVGIKFPSVEANIVTVSHAHADHNQVALVKGTPKVFDFPGEYETCGVRIYGYQTFHDEANGAKRGENTMFKFMMDNLVVLHCGDLGQMPSAEVLSQIEDTDVLLVPVGGFFTMDARQAKALVDKINPEVIIPMHYNSESHNQDNFGEIAPVTEFFKLFGITEPLPQISCEVKSDALPEREIVLLTP